MSENYCISIYYSIYSLHILLCTSTSVYTNTIYDVIAAGCLTWCFQCDCDPEAGAAASGPRQPPG